MESAVKRAWWKERTVYQIYPRSFCDSNADGIGDIPGIISKLDYLADLGIGIIWLSPVYCSPNDDNGYDISNYRDINPEFGTLADMDRLISEAHSRDIRIIMDLVVNHTSDEHEWFKKSRQSKDSGNPYRDYYIWRPPVIRNGRKCPPNNWTSFFTGSAWQYDEQTGEYYLHLFSRKQPDLNWANPKIREEVEDILRFWLDRGIDGFRCDVINVIGKHSLANGRKRIALTGLEHYLSTEECHQHLKKLNEDVFSKYDCYTVGETVCVNTEMASALQGENRGELNTVFSFEHMETDTVSNKWFRFAFKSGKFVDCLCKWQKELSWNANYFENHDQPRSVSHFGDDGTYHDQSAKMLASLLFTLKGTPYVYEGQELGMTNFDFSSLGQIMDIESHNIDGIARKLHFPQKLRWKMIKKTSRDNARTPMQWNREKNAGFSEGKPWLGINGNYERINAEDQCLSNSSVRSYYQKLIQLRKKEPVFVYGDFSRIHKSGQIHVFERSITKESLEEFEEGRFTKIITVINFGKKPRRIGKFIADKCRDMQIVQANYMQDMDRMGRDYILKPYEAVIFAE
ncbi:MAG: alpha-glucosidase [Treponemataceae bacterium]|nr:alpha-glucosidase [Treponemataceae bacterium]